MIAFAVRDGAHIVEVARFNGAWAGDDVVIANIENELASRGMDIASQAEDILKIFSGSYFWAFIVTGGADMGYPSNLKAAGDR